MGAKGGKGSDYKGSRSTRVYAPTHQNNSEEPIKRDRPAQRGPAAPLRRQPHAQEIMRPERQTSSEEAIYMLPVRYDSRQRVSESDLRPVDKPAERRGRTSPKSIKGAKKNKAGRPLAREDHPKPQKTRLVGARGESGEVAGRTRQAGKQIRRGKGVQSAAEKGAETIHRLEPPKREQQKQKQKKKREPMDRSRLLAVMITVVLAVSMLLSGYFVFLVDTIIVEGNESYEESGIIALSGLMTGRHTLLNNIEKAAENIGSNPYIQVISITRELPRAIRITMKERKAFAAIAAQDYSVVIDEEGHVLSIGSSGPSGNDVSGLLHITGISQMGFQVNRQLGPGSDLQVRALLMILQETVKQNLKDDIAAIDITNPLRLSLETSEGITIILGQSDNMEQKMDWLKRVLPSLRAGNITAGILDVSAKGGPVYSPPGAMQPILPEEMDAPNMDIPETDTPETDLPEDAGGEPEDENGPDREV